MMLLSGYITIITGAGSGIGEACALRFAKEGAYVAVVDVLIENGIRTVEQIRQCGGQADFYKVDVTSAKDVSQLVEQVSQKHNRIDVLVNNAGMEVFKPITDTTEAEFDRTINTNLKGVFLGMKYVLPIMKEQKLGSIINMASVAGLSAWPGLGVYSAAKGGVVLLTKAAAAEYGAHNIRVNCICPGSIRTPLLEHQFFGAMEDAVAAEQALVRQYPLNRLGEADEVANIAVFLASNQSSFVTGHAMTVDGGLSAFVGDLIQS